MKFPPVIHWHYSKLATLVSQYISNCETFCIGMFSVRQITQVTNYYSFEWYLDLSSWRASVHLWSPNSFYRHSMSDNRILADSGWHCSYCFRTIPEYTMKMQGFSHSDRIGGRMELLNPARIQDTICRGKDIFGMLPEAYSVSAQRHIGLQATNCSVVS